jgi:hypothetical protein
VNADSNHKTQQGRLLKLLLDHRFDWVPLPDILALGISQYSSRIWEIRHQLGLKVESRVEFVDGKKCSWFRLLSADPQAKLFSKGATTTTATARIEPAETLFGDISRDRTYVE